MALVHQLVDSLFNRKRNQQTDAKVKILKYRQEFIKIFILKLSFIFLSYKHLCIYVLVQYTILKYFCK